MAETHCRRFLAGPKIRQARLREINTLAQIPPISELVYVRQDFFDAGLKNAKWSDVDDRHSAIFACLNALHFTSVQQPYLLLPIVPSS